MGCEISLLKSSKLHDADQKYSTFGIKWTFSKILKNDKMLWNVLEILWNFWDRFIIFGRFWKFCQFVSPIFVVLFRGRLTKSKNGSKYVQFTFKSSLLVWTKWPFLWDFVNSKICDIFPNYLEWEIRIFPIFSKSAKYWTKFQFSGNLGDNIDILVSKNWRNFWNDIFQEMQ